MAHEASATTEPERMVELLSSHPHRAALSALCLDTLSRQAEGGALYTGKKLIGARAREHGVAREDAETELGNVLGWLEKGPRERRHFALIAAFAVQGLADRLSELGDGEGADAAARFVQHADWLHRCSDYAPYDYLVPLLSTEHLSLVWEAMEHGMLGEPVPLQRAVFRMGAVVRLQALADGGDEESRQRLSNLAQHAQDVVVQRAAAGLCEQAGVAASEQLSVHGRLGPASHLDWKRGVRWISGWALLSALGRSVGWAFGARRDATITLRGSEVEVVRRWRMLGRTVRTEQASWGRDAVTGVVHVVRYPTLRLVAGALLAIVGAATAAVVLSDAASHGGRVLWLVGLSALGLGVGLDLLGHFAWPRQSHRADLQLWAGDQSLCAIRNAESEAAKELMRALSAR